VGRGEWRSPLIPSVTPSLLVAGDKSGVAQKRFYKAVIAKADKRSAEHLETLDG